jgi:hypothetical protein
MRLIDRIVDRISARTPDFVVGGKKKPYLIRWYVTPWRRWFRDVPSEQLRWGQRAVIWLSRWLPNVYLHQFLRSDDDRALHDHPWLFNASLMLRGSYVEHTIREGGVRAQAERVAGDLVIRFGSAPHRVELTKGACWTLFITGPIVRDWGFHCERGWVPWEKFVAPGDSGSIGAGCDAATEVRP